MDNYYYIFNTKFIIPRIDHIISIMQRSEKSKKKINECQNNFAQNKKLARNYCQIKLKNDAHSYHCMYIFVLAHRDRHVKRVL